MPYEPVDEEKSYKSVQPCDLCSMDDEPVHAVQTGDGFVIVCASCRAEVVGGS